MVENWAKLKDLLTSRNQVRTQVSYLLCLEGAEWREIYSASDMTGNKRNIGWMLILKSNYKLGSEEAGVSLVMNDGNDSGPWHQSVVSPAPASGQAPHQTSQITDPQPPARFNYKCITRVTATRLYGSWQKHNECGFLLERYNEHNPTLLSLTRDRSNVRKVSDYPQFLSFQISINILSKRKTPKYEWTNYARSINDSCEIMKSWIVVSRLKNFT